MNFYCLLFAYLKGKCVASFDSSVFKLGKKKAKCKNGAPAYFCSGYLHCHGQSRVGFSLLIPYRFSSWVAEAVTELLWHHNLWVRQMPKLWDCFFPHGNLCWLLLPELPMRRCRQGDQLKSLLTFRCGPGHPVPSQEEDRDAAAPSLFSYSCFQLDQIKFRTAFSL